MDSVGLAVGTKVEGANEGEIDGLQVGVDGATDGFAVGHEGHIDGFIVGMVEGKAVGRTVGLVGCNDGNIVG